MSEKNNDLNHAGHRTDAAPSPHAIALAALREKLEAAEMSESKLLSWV